MTTSTLILSAGRIAQLQDARGATLQVQSGCVWITEAGGMADIVVGAGEAFTLMRNGMTVLSTCRPCAEAVLRIERRAQAEASLAAWLQLAARILLGASRPVTALR